MPPVDAELELNIDAALQVLDDLNSRFDDIASTFGDNISNALDQAFQDTTTKLSDYLTQSVDQFSSDLGGLDLSSIGDSVQASLDNVDASGVANQLQDALTTEPIQLSIDTVDLTTQLQDALDSIDTSSLDTSLGDTSGALDEVTRSSEKTKGGLEGASQAANALGIGADAAKGSFSGLVESAVPGAAAFAGVAASVGELVKKADEVQLAAERMNAVFGNSAGAVKKIDIAGLNYSLEGLAAKTGASLPGLELAAAKFGQLAEGAGKSQTQAAAMAKELIVLATNASAANPSLGASSDIIGGIQKALGGNVRALAQYGITLTRTQIDQEAMKETSKTLRTELTPLDRQTAALTLSMAQLGDTVGKRVNDAAKLATVQFRALKEQLATDAATIGAPLIAPVLNLAHTLLPVGEAIGQAFGSLITAALPAFQDIANVVKLITPAIQEMSGVFKALAPILEPVIIAFVAFKVAKEIASLFETLALKTMYAGDSFKNFFTQLKSGKMEFVGLGEALPRIASGLAIGAASFEQAGKSGAQGAMGVLGLTAAGAQLGSVLGPEGAVAGGIIGATVGIGKMTGAFADGGPDVATYRKEFEDLGKSMNSFASRGEIFTSFMKKLGFDDSLSLLQGHAKGVTDELEAMARTSPVAAGKVVQSMVNLRNEAGKPIFNSKEIDKLNAALEKGSVEHTKLAQATSQAAIAAANDTSKQDALTAATIQGTTANGAALFATSLQTAQLKSQASVSQEAVKVAALLTTTTHGTADSIRNAAIAYATAAQSAKDYKATLDILNTGTKTLTDSTLSVKAAQLSWKAGLDGTTSSLDLSTEAGVKNAQSISSMVSLQEAHTQALIAAHAPADQIAADTQNFANNLLQQEENAGVAGQAVADYLKTLGLTGTVTDSAGNSFDLLSTAVGQTLPGDAASGAAQYNTELQKLQAGTQSAVNAAANIFNSDTSIQSAAESAGSRAGTSFGTGIASGMNSQTPYIRSVAASLVAAAKRAADEAAQSSSPSKLFAELGGFMAEGLAIGMIGGSPGVVSAAEMLTRSAAGAVGGVRASISGTPFRIEIGVNVKGDASSSPATLEAVRSGVSDGVSAGLDGDTLRNIVMGVRTG